MSKMLVWKKWKNPISEALEGKNEEHLIGDDEDMLDFDSPDFSASPIIYDPDTMLHLWTAHTNFIVTKKAKRVIKNTPGISYYRGITPYMFNIGVAELFCQQKVKAEVINRLIVDEFEDDLISEHSMTMGDHLDQLDSIRASIKEEFWAIYILPNGKSQVVCSSELDENFITSVKELKACQSTVGGFLATYMDEE